MEIEMETGPRKVIRGGATALIIGRKVRLGCGGRRLGRRILEKATCSYRLEYYGFRPPKASGECGGGTATPTAGDVKCEDQEEEDRRSLIR